MDKMRFEACGRRMRWYEWLAGLALLAVAFGARAGAPIYKCVDPAGTVAYQGAPCAARQQQSEVEISAPPAAAHPDASSGPAPRTGHPHAARSGSAGLSRTPREATAFACHASDGRVFYRLGRCPHSLAAMSGGRGKPATVSAVPTRRSEACRQMRRAGAIGRSGHEFDEQVSTYDKNLGRDPCA